MARIDLINNSGFLWHTKGNCHVKGFAHTADGQYLRGDALAGYFEAGSGFEDFTGRVAGANGMFSVVMVSGSKVWMAVDRMRTFPVFYTAGDSGLLVSDSVDHLIKSLGGWKINTDASAEFLATGYVTGKETLAGQIFQVQAAETLEIIFSPGAGIQAGRTSSSVYSSYRTRKTSEESMEELADKMERITEGVFKRLVKSLQGRTAVIALSGGFDSRLVAAMLKKLDYPAVICFSYGREGNPDMIRAEEVAGKLGFQFIPVIYTDELIENYLAEEAFFDYVRFSSNHVSMFFMQEYFAMKYLRENQLVPGDSVFIPGHSGDFFGGSQLIRHGLHSGREDIRRTIQRIFDVKYAWLKPGGTVRKSMMKRIESSLQEKGNSENALSYSIHEDWDLKEKLAKFIVNSCNIYAWFGYEYRLPLYDYELQDFFRDIPFELKAGKRLYDTCLIKQVFSEPGLNFPAELQPDERTQQRARLKRKIKKCLPGLLQPTTVSRLDPIFYYEITHALLKDLERKGIHIKIRGNSYNSLIVQWYIEYLKAGQTGGRATPTAGT